ncbi:MAG: hypothetical protein QOD84_248, partial [Acidobacteriaceae bacterium]
KQKTLERLLAAVCKCIGKRLLVHSLIRFIGGRKDQLKTLIAGISRDATDFS